MHTHTHDPTLMRTLLRMLTHTLTLLARPMHCLHAFTESLLAHRMIWSTKLTRVCSVVKPSSAPYDSLQQVWLCQVMGGTMTGRASVGPLPRPHVRVWAPRRSARTPSAKLSSSSLIKHHNCPNYISACIVSRGLRVWCVPYYSPVTDGRTPCGVVSPPASGSTAHCRASASRSRSPRPES